MINEVSMEIREYQAGTVDVIEDEQLYNLEPQGVHSLIHVESDSVRPGGVQRGVV